MAIEVIIGHGRNDDWWRLQARGWVAEHYTKTHKLPVTMAECPDDEWSKGAAVNPAIQASDADIIVLADADSFVDDDALQSAIRIAELKGWSMPHSVVRRLSKLATEQVYAGFPITHRLRPERSSYPALPGGGIVVLSRQALEKVPGFDPRFKGWGGEDHALGLSLHALVCPINRRKVATLWHLFHPPAERCRKPNQESRDLDKRYRKARNNPQAMEELVKEWSCQYQPTSSAI